MIPTLATYKHYRLAKKLSDIGRILYEAGSYELASRFISGATETWRKVQWR